jgi:hypothetical protein
MKMPGADGQPFLHNAAATVLCSIAYIALCMDFPLS